jgi:hypothetical protein
MSKTATIACAIQQAGSQTTVSGPTSIGPYTQANSAGILTIISPNIGDNIVLFPFDLSFSEFWIDPTAAVSGVTLTLKQVSGDVGVPISTVNPSLIPLATIDWRIIGSSPVVSQCILNVAGANGPVTLPIGWL